MIAIVPLTPALAASFAELQRTWLRTEALYEPIDEADLADPIRTYADRGGAVFAAVDEASALVGSCAVARFDDASFELSRLAVVAELRGHGLGRRLLECAITFARDQGASRLVLTSNSRLVSALRLYERAGFVYEPVPHAVAAKYQTADVFMTLRITA